MEGLVKPLDRAVSVLEICQRSQQFGQNMNGNKRSCRRGWWLEHLHGALLGEAKAGLTSSV